MNAKPNSYLSNLDVKKIGKNPMKVNPKGLDLKNLQSKWRKECRFELTNNHLVIKMFPTEERFITGVLPQSIADISKRIQSCHFKNIYHLSLDLSECSMLEQHGILNIYLLLLPLLKRLRHLSLNLPHTMDVSEGTLAKLCYRICYNCRYLETLSIKVLKNYRIITRDTELLRMISVIGKSAKKLKGFNLRFPRMKGQLANKMSLLISHYMAGIHQLSLAFPILTLSLNPDQGLLPFIKRLGSRMQNLHHLSLDLSMLDGTSVLISKGIDDLSVGFKEYFGNLVHLTLLLSGCDSITDEKLSNLTQLIAENLKKLQGLTLNVGKCRQLTIQECKNIGSDIGTHLKDIQQLSLDFGLCPNINDFGISQFASGFSLHIQSLTHLSLNFSRCEEITGEGVKRLSLMFNQNLKTLQTLSLDFSWCGRISNTALIELATQIGENLTQLKHLSLIFATNKSTSGGIKFLGVPIKSYEISDKGLKKFSTIVSKNLRQLEQLSLKFENYMLITNKGVKKLCSDFGQNLGKLQKLHLNFRMCGKVTLEGKEYANKALKFVPKLEFYLI